MIIVVLWMLTQDGCGRSHSWFIFRYCPDICCLKEVTGVTKSLVKVEVPCFKYWNKLGNVNYHNNSGILTPSIYFRNCKTCVAHDSIVGWGTMLQAERSWVWFSNEVIGFFNWPNPSRAQGSTQPRTEMSSRNLPGGKGHPARKAGNLTTICEPIV
jgi:hypothetical protein